MPSPTSMVLARRSPSPPPLPSTSTAAAQRVSPRRLAQKNATNDTFATPIIGDKALSFDDDHTLLTPRSLSPSPSPPKRDKKAAAAANIKKVRQKILSKASSRKKKTKQGSLPKQQRKKMKRKPMMKDTDDDSGMKPQGKRKRRFSRDNFFDDNDDDSFNTAADVEKASEYFDDDDKEDGDAVGGDHDEDKDGEAVVVDPEMVGRHRQVFMERAFGGAGEDTAANNIIVRPQSELDEIVFVLEHWEVGVPLKSITDPEHHRAVKLFRKTHKPAYKWVNSYYLERIELPDGTQRKVLRRIEPKRATGRIVMSQETVFDAINEWHYKRGHLGQERTHAFCRDKYYNCTQDLVRIYCETCYFCMKKNPTVTATKGSSKPIRSNGFRDRFQIDLIDFRKMRKRDPFGVLMQWIVTIKDHSTGVTHVSAIPLKKARFVAHRLQEVFGMIGYPSIFHTDNGKEFTARRILNFLRSINPSIITVTGRPRQPSDQGSVESMNRLVKRIVGSELAERRAAGENPNWTEILGAVMSTINSQHGRMNNSVSAYEAIYGQKYDQLVSCSLEEARQCWTVDQRLKVCCLAMKFSFCLLQFYYCLTHISYPSLFRSLMIVYFLRLRNSSFMTMKRKKMTMKTHGWMKNPTTVNI